jgi:hypothetical protein
MVVSSPTAIADVEDLASALGDTFVVLFGSAVSGVSTPRVPMVFEAKEEVLRFTALKLLRGSSTERLVSHYAMELVRGRYRNIVTTQAADAAWD